MEKHRLTLKFSKPTVIWGGFIAFILAFHSPVFADELALPATDLTAPEGEHNHINNSMTAGENLTINAQVTDNVGVATVTLFYRTIGTESFHPIVMSSDGDNVFSVTVKGEFISVPGIEYYIQAEDRAGNTRTFGYQFSPYLVKVTPDGEDNELNLDFDDAKDRNDASNSSIALVTDGSSKVADGKSIFSNKWFWVGVGVLAAAAASSEGDSDGGETGGGSIIIGGPSP